MAKYIKSNFPVSKKGDEIGKRLLQNTGNVYGIYMFNRQLTKEKIGGSAVFGEKELGILVFEGVGSYLRMT